LQTNRHVIRGLAGIARVAGAICLGILISALAGVFAGALTGCATRTGSIAEETPTGPVPSYLYLIIVHGDASYLYHDEEGSPHQADEEVIARAVALAEGAKQAEVHIFHLNPVKGALLFRGGAESDYSLYRGGELVKEERYRRDIGNPGFQAEVEMFRQNVFGGKHSPGDGAEEAGERGGGWKGFEHSFFFFFGHQIPEFDGRGYNLSRPHATFTVDDLTDGLDGFRRAGLRGNPFDLVVLSVCYGGTPGILLKTAPRARYIMTSPDVLHLSQFDLSGFREPARIRRQGLHPFLREAAYDAFEVLCSATRTTVTVALYDAGAIEALLEPARDRIMAHIRAAQETPGVVEYYDCGDGGEFAALRGSAAVDVFYRPPQFGRDRDRRTHSGLECWRVLPSP
jgi:hypothetical protein